VLGEQQAGNNDKGSVDMIWINGENFKTMKQAKLLFCGYTDKLPNNQYVNWDDPAVANDFGEPVVKCEVPWNRAQIAMIYNSDNVKTPPKNMAAFLDWVKANPGRFTYPAPPDFTGSAFVRHIFYYASGDYKKLLGPFDQKIYDDVAAKTWKILNDIKPSLWHNGQTYPKDITALDQLFANGEVDFDITYDPNTAGANIDKGTFPKSTKTFVFDDGTIGNVNYVAIPYNSPNKAAAVVLANLLLSPEAQYQKAIGDVWGTPSSLDLSKVTKDWQDKFAALPRNPAVVSAQELAKHSLPELQAKWLTTIETDWKTNVASK
jgi:putative spermidine/putrescine transport system substrate-binding protein